MHQCGTLEGATKGPTDTENSSVKITPTGTLIFRHFKYDMSGIYTCSLVFKPTAEQAEKNYLLKYVIYAYSDPNFYYEFTARYHAAPCNSIYNISFEKKLLQILSKLVIELSCEVTLLKSECHHVKMQKAGLQNEIFFTFTVSSLDTEKTNNPCQQKSCDTAKRLKKAKNLIERFFNQQVEVLGKRSEPLPEIYYIEGTLQMVWVNRCYPGYGINTLIHPDCPDCCVLTALVPMLCPISLLAQIDYCTDPISTVFSLGLHSSQRYIVFTGPRHSSACGTTGSHSKQWFQYPPSYQ
ncbi:Zona pellucida-binding protein 1 [Chelonia mydas]|uniref:Zona pellucida-binding protein 1 n=1 Tax=Chelonia mydas TaxID=8469 RepID=M7B8S2_CHEMY|nr:Zona pellucida-binding protein 1 [Chelonia mydas]